MAKIIGRNALVYVGGQIAPNRNQVTVNFNREMQEARVFQDVVAGGPWSDQIPGFRNWTVNINGYYDDSDSIILSAMNSASAMQVVIYENRATGASGLGRYWYGDAYFTLTEEIGVDNIVTLNMTGTGTGPLTRIPIV